MQILDIRIAINPWKCSNTVHETLPFIHKYNVYVQYNTGPPIHLPICSTVVFRNLILLKYFTGKFRDKRQMMLTTGGENLKYIRIVVNCVNFTII